MLLIDANARVGEVTCGSIGGIAAEKENKNGARFRDTLSGLQLCAFNTFVDAGYTWRSNYDTVHRIDYICGPLFTFDWISNTRVLQDLELSTAGREDHRCVASTLSLPVASSPNRDADNIASKKSCQL